MKARFAMLLVANAVLAPGALAHKSGVEQIEEVVVYGRSMQMIGVARAASEGVVGYDDYAAPPLLRAGELLEAVPGMVATQHSGTGKANQYFLRGFNLDHGTDFAGFAEGVPLNLRTHGHGQGYLDLNWVIPELVERTNFRKGPYSADIGDFGSAGSANIGFYERIAEPYVTGIVGYDNFARGVAVGSLDTGLGVVTGALDATRYDGPWVIPEDLHAYKGYLALADKLGELDAKLSFQAYDSRWDATDQIPLRAVEGAQIDRLGYIDPDLGGDTSRYAVTGSLSHEAWLVSAYAIRYDLSLFSNFTYFLADPTDGDEFEQRDDRTVFGGFARHAWDLTLAQLPIAARVGADIRRDHIDELGLFHTVSRSPYRDAARR
jgi:hypothetical protein